MKNETYGGQPPAYGSLGHAQLIKKQKEAAKVQRDVDSFNHMQKWRQGHKLSGSQQERVVDDATSLVQQGASIPAKGKPLTFDAISGGLVPPGPPGVDTVPAMMSSGPAMLDSQPGPGEQEYVLPADTTAKVGVPVLDALKAATHNPTTVRRRRLGLPQLADGSGAVSEAEGNKRAADIVTRLKAKHMKKKPTGEVPAPAPVPETQPAFPETKSLYDRIKKAIPGLADGTPPQPKMILGQRKDPVPTTPKERARYLFATDKPVMERLADPLGFLRRTAEIVGSRFKDMHQSGEEQFYSDVLNKPKEPPMSDARAVHVPDEGMQLKGPSPHDQALNQGVRPVKTQGSTAGYRYDVPEEQQDEFGKAILSGTAEGATPEAMNKQGTFSVMPRDFYDGVDTRGMSDVEYQEFKGMRDRENALRLAAVGQGKVAAQEVESRGRPFGYKPPLLYPDVQPGLTPSSQFKLMMDAQRQQQEVERGKGLDKLIDRNIKLATHRRAEEDQEDDRRDNFLESAELLNEEVANFPWMRNSKLFFADAYDAGAPTPKAAAQRLAQVYQAVADRNEPRFVTVAGKDISGAEAIEILKGEEPYWFHDDEFYEAARQAIIAEIQAEALRPFRQ